MSGTDGTLTKFDLLIPGLVLTYGPTCSGKRFSIFGPNNEGLLTYSVQYILDNVFRVPFLSSLEFSCSFFQLYNEQIHDLLAKDAFNLRIVENKGGIEIKVLKKEFFSLLFVRI